MDGTDGLTRSQAWTEAQIRSEDDKRTMQMQLLEEHASAQRLLEPQFATAPPSSHSTEGAEEAGAENEAPPEVRGSSGTGSGWAL